MTELDTNPTQITGLLAFLIGTLAAAFAARRGPATVGWWRVAALQAGCWVEVLVGFRHRAHNLVDDLLRGLGWYDARTPLQVLLLVAVLALAVLTLAGLSRLRRAPPPLRVAVIASVAVLWLFAIESVSLHAVDAVMYRRIGPVLLIGWLWATCAAVVTWAALQGGMLRRESAAARRR